MERHNRKQEELKWFAAKTFTERAYVLKYLEYERVRVERISDIPSLLFINCNKRQISRFRYDLYGKMYVYRSAASTEPESIPDRTMKTFLLMAPYHDEPVIYLAVDDESFFSGARKRVTKGLFKGCEGIVRRLKGQRRLIVRVGERAAIATPYIPVDFLEDIED